VKFVPVFCPVRLSSTLRPVSEPDSYKLGTIEERKFRDSSCKRHQQTVSVLPALLCKQGVAGSIPVTSTNLIPALSIIYAALSLHYFGAVSGQSVATAHSEFLEERIRSAAVMLML